VDETRVAKLCDFGLVRLVDWEGPAGMTTTSPYTGTARYKAPELFMSSENRHPVATFEGDIYSVGCIMLEVWLARDNEHIANLFQPSSLNSSIHSNDFEGASSAVRSLWRDIHPL
jgi:serine/threonine protein kinase